MCVTVGDTTNRIFISSHLHTTPNLYDSIVVSVCKLDTTVATTYNILYSLIFMKQILVCVCVCVCVCVLLNRTNGAQFAVAMKFLNVALQALGICNGNQGLEPTSQMLVSLMEMYGEMGDKIALQYGGSEAHRKVPGGQVASAVKQSELLTSIKVSVGIGLIRPHSPPL